MFEEAHTILEDEYGSTMVYWFMENAQYLINGEMIIGEAPQKIKTKKVLGIF
ncbi:hypothetical protein JCM21714_4442 [Gracilibacillus boraciitolerans JCM 21714]|uniref:Uncharacterized protein n=1 Tax=Gracilibacillus boraciitolerans JCM 21714 TaxID=1298598 RepID=W4VPU7_9BACI|nr:hypothetical protein JCM21714_4442 [Gracilibacillus boraciitolerans JCM 21714]